MTVRIIRIACSSDVEAVEEFNWNGSLDRTAANAKCGAEMLIVNLCPSPPSAPSVIFPYPDITIFHLRRRKAWRPLPDNHIQYLFASAREYRTAIEPLKKPWHDQLAVEQRARRYTQTKHLRNGQRREVKARSRKSRIWDIARSTSLSDEATGLVVTIKLKTIVTGNRCRYTHDRPLVGCWPSKYLMREGNVYSYDRPSIHE